MTSGDFENNDRRNGDWRKRLTTPEAALDRLRPGMNIFIGTGVAEPRTLVKALMASDAPNIKDLVLVQLFSFGDAISLEGIQAHKFRLKTFFAGWVASQAIRAGNVDLIPCRFVKVPDLIRTRQIPVDVAMVQITPPDAEGYASVGVTVDVVRQAMECADIVIGEINPSIPRTFGDTFVKADEFDLFVDSREAPIYFERWPEDEVFNKVAANVAALIEDGACLAFSIGPLFDALARALVHKRHLGVHTPIITDALMDLIRSGAVTNRRKGNWRGKTVTAYAIGSRKLLAWLDRNPLVEFQGVDKVYAPTEIGKNARFKTVLPARKVDLSGRVALHVGKANVATNPAEVLDFVSGADISPGGRAIFALPSRNLSGDPNIRLSVAEMENQFPLKEWIDMVVTEYGVAYLKGRTIRERAQALIDIAHPGDRKSLVTQAKAARLIYADQIFLADSVHLYPSEIQAVQVFKNGVAVRFRAIKPSDEEEMRRLFYRFSDQAIYYRYFAPVKVMPHSRMQSYVNIDYRDTLSIVGLTDDPDPGRIIAEARFSRDETRPYAEVAFVVDESWQGQGIATYLYRMLTRLAKERGLKGFTASVLATNRQMMRVFEKGLHPVKAALREGVYELTIPFEEGASTGGSPS